MSASELEAKIGDTYPLARQASEALEGAVYPLDLRQVVLVARENEAPAVLLTLLSGLPHRRTYASLAEVQEALDEVSAQKAAESA